MPFDGQPSDHETKPDVFSLAGLIAWLKTQDPETEYVFSDGNGCEGGCLWHRYFRSHGFKDVDVAGDHATVDGRDWLFPGNTHKYQFGTPGNKIASGLPYTYGAALKRAESLMEKPHAI